MTSTLLEAALMNAATATVLAGIVWCVTRFFRNPAVLANIASTIDHVSNGRLELGIGAGWYEMEHDEYGIPFHTVGRRIRMLGDGRRVRYFKSNDEVVDT